MPATRFPERAEGIADRMTGFITHLRYNGMTVGVSETECALEALTQIDATDPQQTRLALKAICANESLTRKTDGAIAACWNSTPRARAQGRKTCPTIRMMEKPRLPVKAS